MLLTTNTSRLAREEMLDSIRLLCLRGKLQVVTGNKSLVEMSTGLVSFLISSECYRSTSQLWDTTFAPWYTVLSNGMHVGSG
ncbi:unnamed protein product [Cuscuta campestris]|uniref:Uncharacterized protein n=1 Tax=Cuscuta campestris TaxID=132261 RepID=A0A484NQG3_9ASTE|nr:unnamed protein product [Cuscuta campestris]